MRCTCTVTLPCKVGAKCWTVVPEWSHRFVCQVCGLYNDGYRYHPVKAEVLTWHLGARGLDVTILCENNYQPTVKADQLFPTKCAAMVECERRNREEEEAERARAELEKEAAKEVQTDG